MIYNGPFAGYKDRVMRVLAVIAKNAATPPTAYEICQTLELGSGTVYPALEKLEKDEVSPPVSAPVVF